MIRKPIPRSPRTLAKHQVAASRKSFTSRLLKLWPVIVGISVVVAWALVNGAAALDTGGKFWHWWTVDQAYTGVWTNDGEYSVDGAEWGAPDGDRVKLAITVKGREVGGDLHGDRLCKFLPWRYVMFEGYAKWWGFGGLRGRAYDYIGGKKTQFAEFNIYRDPDTRTLVLDEITGSLLFPKHAVLLKTSDAEGQTVSTHDVEPLCYGNKGSESKTRVPISDLTASIPPFAPASAASSTASTGDPTILKPRASSAR